MTDLIRGAGHAQELALRIAQEAADRFQERAEKAEAVIPGLVEAGERLIPRNLNLANPNVTDSADLHLCVTLGELRSLRNALDAARKAGF
jgi:hypothetical protein